MVATSSSRPGVVHRTLLSLLITLLSFPTQSSARQERIPNHDPTIDQRWPLAKSLQNECNERSVDFSSASACTTAPSTLQLVDPPYKNFFYSDCHSATQIVVTSPLPDSNLTVIGPRFLIAWPAGNSGIATFFQPQNGINGSLSIGLVNANANATQPVHGVYHLGNLSPKSGIPRVGITTLLNFNSSATLSIPILGSIRNIRDFTEGPSLLHDIIQDANRFTPVGKHGAMISRLWLDNKTTTEISFVPTGEERVMISEGKLYFGAGTYNVTATLNYPQLSQTTDEKVLNPQSQGLIPRDPDGAESLSFLSYSDKLLAGAWRFLTYFGRDSMISLLLMQSILSEGRGGAVEAVISSVLDRLDHKDGAVCHEETIGDYATFVNLENNITSTAPSCTYFMIDTDYFLAPIVENYFLKSAVGSKRKSSFFSSRSTKAFGNRGSTYGQLLLKNTEFVMKTATAFASPDGQKKENLIHLEPGYPVGQWRDSMYGIGGGRIPFDVNTALVPAALRSIAVLSAAGFFPQHPDWNVTAAKMAQIWEDETLHFFNVSIPAKQAKSLVTDYTSQVGVGFPSRANAIDSTINFNAIALDGNDDQALVKVMHTDDCFRHFLLNTTNQPQLTSFLNQTANNILRPYPLGLSVPQGLLIANPAYGGNPVYAQNFTHSAYHGTVIWGWPMAMMVVGLQRQLDRCTVASSSPDFCHDPSVRANVRHAYNHLWDLIDANQAHLTSELWSWTYEKGKFNFIEFGALPPPPGISPTESDVRQLWSLAFLAIKRDEHLM